MPGEPAFDADDYDKDGNCKHPPKKRVNDTLGTKKIIRCSVCDAILSYET